MAAPAISHYWSWGAVPEKFYGNVMAEFRDNGVNRLILTHFLLPRFAEEPEFRKSVLSLCSRFGHGVSTAPMRRGETLGT